MFEGDLRKRKADEGEESAKLSAGGPSKKKKDRVHFGENQVFTIPSARSKERKAIDNESDEFDEDDDDDLERARKKRGLKGNVNLAGYDSDEEEAGDAVDEEDIFAEKPQPKGKLAGLTMEEEEAQERFRGDADPGEVFEPFNMDQELQEGGFDENGQYLLKKDENVYHDRWLQGVTEEDIAKANRAHQRQIAREQMLSTTLEKDENALLLSALRQMKPRENIFAALRRLAPPKKPKSKPWQKKKTQMSVDTVEDENEQIRKKSVEDLTTASDQLMALTGNSDTYELTYEQIVRKLRVAEILEEYWQPGDEIPLSSVSSKSSAGQSEKWWEYKMDQTDEEVFGPFKTQNIKEWYLQV
ncbi:hypothetical protein HK098_000311 [Nowakowskiella sp. JEL0407]|nr:hypothetical protein HK098_000311 [Nowakowskiella sp. JEL0407]